MSDNLLEDRSFENIDFTKTGINEGTYENCRFLKCNFSSCLFSHMNFIDCMFENCNLSLVKICNLTLNEVVFKDCKQLGWDFTGCNNVFFSASFEDCNLNFSVFSEMNLKGTSFSGCTLQEADFRQANLASARFINCDLERAIFVRTNLEKADFRTSFNYTLDPDQNRIKKAKFSFPAVLGLLSKYDISIE
ncbi:MAG: hypothetical protein A2W80_02020 [Candidatus Riflebacteria bacterium GWC2_50_8]|nr:MAG: hypothetical protein A2W80_02020 [Candidatus Riflebacteria bacterium GWC2_50_8]